MIDISKMVISVISIGIIISISKISISITQVLYCLAVVSLALHLLTILYAAFGLSELAYNSQPDQAFGLPDLEQVFVREEPSEEERVKNEKWEKSRQGRDSRREEGRERREGKQGGRGDVEFVHPDLKKELLKQGEDPANPWVWLTSYSRIPVTFCLALDFWFFLATLVALHFTPVSHSVNRSVGRVSN